MAENIITLKNVKVKHKMVEFSDIETTKVEKGELVIAAVPGTDKDPHTGAVTTPAYVIKVGTGTDGKSGWLNAPASDVYEWAKKASITDVDAFKALQDEINDLTGGSEGGNTGSIATQIANAIEALNVDATTGKYVTKISQENGKIVASSAPSIPMADIEGLADEFNKKVNNSDFNDFKGTNLNAGAYTTFAALSNAVYAFLNSEAELNQVVDTLVEIQKYITDDTEAFKTLSSKVTGLEGKTTLGKDENDQEYATVKAYVEAETKPWKDFAAGADTGTDAVDTLKEIQGKLGDHDAALGKTALFNADTTKNEVTISNIAGIAGTTLIIDCN